MLINVRLLPFGIYTSARQLYMQLCTGPQPHVLPESVRAATEPLWCALGVG